ncbi:TPA: DUF2975 domain-containing protein [Legionella pneumophila]|nr:DUF2975 domain-containing protein [Legionella pneumophila]
MNKIQRVSSYCKIFFQISFLLLTVGFVFSWVAVGMGYTVLHEPWARFSIALLENVARLLILFFLIQLFKSYENNEILSVKNAFLIRNIGYTLLVKQTFIPLLNCIITRNLKGIFVDNIEMIVLSLLIIVSAWIMKEAYAIKEEHQLTV